MSALEYFKLPLLESIIPDGVKAGSILLAEYDPESQWLSVAATITARYVMSGSNACHAVCVRPRQHARRDLSRLGLDVDKAEEDGLLRVDDWYAATLSLERSTGASRFYEVLGEGANSYVRINSLKVSDLSIEWLRLMKDGHPYIVENWPPGHIIVLESVSPMLRFNDEKTLLDWIEGRVNPYERSKNRIEFQGVVRGIHSESFYKRMESASDGVIDVRVVEQGDQVKNLIRVRSIKGQPHDTRWHEIQVKSNGEAAVLS